MPRLSVTNSLDVLRERLLRQIARNRTKKPVSVWLLSGLYFVVIVCYLRTTDSQCWKESGDNYNGGPLSIIDDTEFTLMKGTNII